MYAIVTFDVCLEEGIVHNQFKGLRVFATLAEAKAYRLGRLDVYGHDNYWYAVVIYNTDGTEVDPSAG